MKNNHRYQFFIHKKNILYFITKRYQETKKVK